MSETLIKGAAGKALARVRSLPAPAQRHMPPTEQPNPELLASQRRVAELEAQLARTALERDTLRSEVERALVRGRAEGHAEGIRAADRREEERLALMTKGLCEARSDLTQSLKGAERLAALVARDCLDKLLGDPAYRADILYRMIRVQMAQINADSVILITVSPNDFADEAALADLRTATGTQQIAMRADPALESGGCILELRLGKADVGLGQQWTALGSLLTELDQERAEA